MTLRPAILISLLCCAAMLPPALPKIKAKHKTSRTYEKGAELLIAKVALVTPPKGRTNDLPWKLTAFAKSNYWWNLETSTNLRNWSVLRSNVCQTNPASWTVTNNRVERMRFYRLSGRLTP